MFQKNRFLFVLLFAVQSLFAQIPQGFNYQATVRNQTGELLTNEYVGIRFHIVQGTEQNNPVYSEFHYAPTDDLGSLHLMIGQGTVEAGVFNQIDWSLGDYHTGIEINTGSGFIDMGTTQLMSVPFALYALNSGTNNNASLPQGNTIGDVLSWNGSAWTVATSSWNANLPEVNTYEAYAISAFSSLVEGEVLSDGGSSITAKGVVWSENPDPTVALPTKTDEGPGPTFFRSHLTELSPNTTYHYRAYATNSKGSAYGTSYVFTTRDGVVSLTTNPVSNFTMNLTRIIGNITDDGGAAITARGVCWSTLANPTIADNKTEDGTGTGSFSSSLNGLTPDTTYYLRSYATNAAGTFYGEEQTFTTGDWVVALTTNPISSFTMNSALIVVNISDDGGAAITARGVCWSTLANPTIADNKTEDGTGTGSFSRSLNGLTPDTTYYLRSYATNAAGTVYGDEQTFTTLNESTGLLIGEWVMWPNPAAMMIASSLDPEANGNWWSSTLQDVGMRSCFFDDKYVFSADKSFTNDVGDTTWTEFDGTQCVDAFAPYDGSIEANWIHDVEKGTVTLNGQGSYLGIKKVANGVELADATGAPSSRTYDILSLTENVLSLRIAVDNAGGLDGENAYWYFILAKVGSEEAEIPQTDGDGDGVLDINDECPEEAGAGANGCAPVPSFLIGEWVMWPNPAAMMIASSLDPETNGNWWANNLQDVGMRSCFFDDKYVFSADKSFTNDVGDTTWTEFDGTQCVDAFAPYDGSIEANWIHDVEKGTVTLNGQGSYLGIKKVANGVELADATGAPSSRTYDILSLTENVLSLRIAVDNAGGLDGENAYWYFILAKVGSEEAEIPQTDGDGDGVLDINDECPEEAGALATGCNPEGEVSTPTAAPAAPTAAQADVLSIFSDAYTDLAGSDFDPDWGQGTDATIETYAGNEVLQYKNLNYQGLQYTQSDVSGYTKLHLDYWTADATTINVSLISAGPLENPVALPVTTGSWQSVDINLSEYSTPNLSEVFQLKTDGDGTVILDNIYFY